MSWSDTFINVGTALGGYGLANSASRKVAEDNRYYDERMQNTAVQRRVNDLREAGLNPILAAGDGAGTGSPQGAQVPELDNLANSAMDYKIKKQTYDNLKWQQENIISDTALKRGLFDKAREDSNVSASSARFLDTQDKALTYQIPKLKNLSVIEGTGIGSWLGGIQRGREAILGK